MRRQQSLLHLAALALLLSVPPAQATAPVPLPILARPTATDRVLVIAPHPDDETLCCAGLLQQALQAGAQIAVVWITAGDSFEIDAVVTEHTLRPLGPGLEKLGLRRITEAHAAADLLGVPRAHQYMLGFPDRDISALVRGARASVVRSRYTGASAVPYADALSPGTAYSGEGLRRNLQQVIDQFAPTLVLAAAPQDRHSDHSASGELALELLRPSHAQTRLYYWIVHAGRDWPAPHGLHRSLSLQPPRSAAALAWQQLPLDESQSATKLQALRAHRTQLEVMSWFLYSFVRANEIYAPVP